MNFMTLLLHAGTIFGAIKSLETVASDCIVQKRAPSKADAMVVVGAIESLLESGVIALPIPAEEIKAALEGIKAQLA